VDTRVTLRFQYAFRAVSHNPPMHSKKPRLIVGIFLPGLLAIAGLLRAG